MADEISEGMSEATREGSRYNWNTENAYWRANYGSRPYASADRHYEYYEPAYQYGAESSQRYQGRRWDEVEPELRSGWEKGGQTARSGWEEMKGAIRDAWDRLTGGREGDASAKDRMKHMAD